MNQPQLAKKRTELVKLVSQYEVPFENIVDDKKARTCFHEYLKANLNEEPLLFMTELDHYVTLIGTKARYKSATKIVEDYLQANSKHAINVSNALRQDAYDVLAKSDESNCPKDMFDEIRLSVYLDLKQCLPGFLDSDTFRTHVLEEMKVDSDYMGSVGSPKTDSSVDELSSATDSEVTETLSSTSQIPENTDLFYNPKVVNVTDADFDRILDDMSNEHMWRKVHSSSKRSVYVSKDTFGKRGLKKMMETAIYPFSPSEIFYALTDERYFDSIERGMKDPQCIHYQKFQQYAGTVIHKKLKKPLLQVRDFVVLKSCRREKDGSYFIMKKSVELDLKPEMKGCTRALACGGYLIQKIDERSSRLTLTAYVDFSGWTPSSLFNQLSAWRDDSYYKAVTSACKERRKLGLDEPGRSYSVLDTMKHYEKFWTAPTTRIPPQTFFFSSDH